MAVDEGYFHRRRGLPRWERVGHPLDTLTVIAAFLWALWAQPSPQADLVYGALALFSCIFVTKDEWVHRRHCSAAEQWLHALLFIAHPCVLASAALIWKTDADLLRWPTALMAAFFMYQVIYWNGPWRNPCGDAKRQ